MAWIEVVGGRVVARGVVATAWMTGSVLESLYMVAELSEDVGSYVAREVAG